jgi:hypothetical protein
LRRFYRRSAVFRQPAPSDVGRLAPKSQLVKVAAIVPIFVAETLEIQQELRGRRSFEGGRHDASGVVFADMEGFAQPLRRGIGRERIWNRCENW